MTAAPALDVPCPVLQEMYLTKKVETLSGESRELSSAIEPACVNALYRLVKERKPAMSAEVGFANGGSTLTILTALKEVGNDGRLISVDPVQSTNWAGGGLTAIRKAGLADQHRLVEDYDYLALPKLLGEGIKLDFAYIDGWHTVDYALLDFFYFDKMLKPGGVVAFNDAAWRGVHKAIKFVLTHRRYRELDVGLAASAGAGSLPRKAMRWVEGRMLPDRYFEKLEHWEPTYNFYAPF